MSDSKKVHRVVMGKKVARKYIEDVSETGYTLTVYSSNYEALEGFLSKIQREFPDRVSSVREEFDFATVLSMDKEAIHKIKEIAISKNLEISGG